MTSSKDVPCLYSNQETAMNEPVRPTDALRTLSLTCDTEIWGEVGPYIAMLEQSFQSRYSLRKDSPAGTPTIVGEYQLVVHDSLEGESRPFDLTIYRNKVCSWHDKQESIRRGASYDFETLKRRVIEGPEPVIGVDTLLKDITDACDNHRIHEFTIDTPISDEVYWRIVEKEALMTYNFYVPKDVTDPIDVLLARTFWNKVNRYLDPKLTRIVK